MGYSIDHRDQCNRVWPKEVPVRTGLVYVLVTLQIRYGCKLTLRCPRCSNRADVQSSKHRFIGGTNTTGEFMNQHSQRRASIPNPALEPFSLLIGSWKTTGTHGLVPDTILHGQTSFEWLENGAFLLMRSEIDDPRFPGAIAIIGSDDAGDGAEAELYMLTFDERGVSRKYQVTLHNNIWKWWRNAPGFFQHFQGTIADDGNTIVGKGELSKDGFTWEKDLDLTYERVD
jgi:hypothetical protein